MSNDHFRQFVNDLEGAIACYGESLDDRTTHQRKQVEGLVKLEIQFRKALAKHPRGPGLYKEFVSHIIDTRKNILAARPYFRERQEIFKNQISPMLRTRNHKGLFQFNINWRFVSFALHNRSFNKGSAVIKLAKEIEVARKALIEQNMPLALSRARIFKKSTPQGHLDHMDLVQISSEGLIAAVDKFVLPYTPVFRAVIIGRITGNLIQDFSETMLHFYPVDKRKIYKAQKVRGRQVDMSSEDIAYRVNISSDPPFQTDGGEVHRLLSAASHISLDMPLTSGGEDEGDDGATMGDRCEADIITRPDYIVEENEVRVEMRKAMKGLPLLSVKCLQLRGIEL